ncbi:type II secretion system GspH family protein [Tateyamaria omphalii]|uniref:pilus assembly FimT family protein n=1 Tax=Tateyamaria omphalii TaxID=299262 RepID=UPI001C998407|nr:type II secretion system protein [Tateyamaria omphalii]MBY5934927.1 type II secretion system GspH family protein [Tateyamaria omphalii]
MSLLETLIVLSITALVIGVAIPSFRPPPRHLALQEELSRLEREALAVRLRAIRSGIAQVWKPDVLFCSSSPNDRVVYLSDGSALSEPFCIRQKDTTYFVTVSPLTGRVQLANHMTP